MFQPDRLFQEPCCDFVWTMEPSDVLALRTSSYACKQIFGPRATAVAIFASSRLILHEDPLSLVSWLRVWQMCKDASDAQGWACSVWAHAFHWNVKELGWGIDKEDVVDIPHQKLKSFVRCVSDVLLSSCKDEHVAALVGATSQKLHASHVLGMNSLFALDYFYDFFHICFSALILLSNSQYAVFKAHAQYKEYIDCKAWLSIGDSPTDVLGSDGVSWIVDGGGRLVLEIASFDEWDKPVLYEHIDHCEHNLSSHASDLHDLDRELRQGLGYAASQRQAADGIAYTLSEFVEWYHNPKLVRQWWANAAPVEEHELRLAKMLTSSFQGLPKIAMGLTEDDEHSEDSISQYATEFCNTSSEPEVYTTEGTEQILLHRDPSAGNIAVKSFDSDLTPALQASEETANQEESVYVVEVLMPSKADPISADEVHVLRFTRYCESVKKAIMTSPALEECRNRVLVAGCEVAPDWAGGAHFLVPMTLQQFQETGFELKVHHLFIRFSDISNLKAALLSTTQLDRPKFRMDRRARNPDGGHQSDSMRGEHVGEDKLS